MFQTIEWLVKNHFCGSDLGLPKMSLISKSPRKVRFMCFTLHLVFRVCRRLGLQKFLQLCQRQTVIMVWGVRLSGARGSNSLCVLLLSAANDASWAACKTMNDKILELMTDELFCSIFFNPFFNYRILINYK